MKKTTLSAIFAVGMVYTVLSSFTNGPGLGGQNKTGACGSATSCADGGCHMNGSWGPPAVLITVDSIPGLEVDMYIPGETYIVSLTAAHATNKFGFQFAAVSGIGASQVNAGTFSSIPSQVALRTMGTLNVLEHTSVISMSPQFVKWFYWTAPPTDVGDITMYLTVNAVNGDGTLGGDISNNFIKVLSPHPTPSTVAGVSNEISINAFPNPATDVLNIQATNIFGNYTVQAFDFAGRSVLNTTVNGIATISTANWTSGVYNVVVTGETGRKAIQIVKQ